MNSADLLSFKTSFIPDAKSLLHLPYIPLILPSTQSYIQESSSDPWVMTEAWLNEELIGLGLAEVYPYNSAAEIYSLVVQPSYRQKGIGLLLMTHLEKWLTTEEKSLILGLSYEKDTEFSPIIEKILFRLNWPPARTALVRYFFDVLQFNPPWFTRPYQFPSDLKIFSWDQLSFQDQQQIDYLIKQGRVLPYLSPSNEEEPIHFPTSIGLRQQDCLVGWSITHLIDPQIVRYTSLFIDQTLKNQGLGIYLMIESIRRQQQMGLPKGIFEVNPQAINKAWIHFIQKRLSPWAIQKQIIKTAIQTYNI